LLKKEKIVEKTKRELPKYQRSMKGPRRKPLIMHGLPNIVLNKVRHYTQFILIYFYMPMLIKPHSMDYS
jgi:hypothetical protein